MATDRPALLTRRQALALSIAGCLPGGAAAAPPPRFVTAWDTPQGSRVGVLALREGRLHIAHAIEVPTRAHGLTVETGGSVLAVARRPGDWLLRWWPAQGRAQWAWTDDGTTFNGHAIASRDGRRIFTTETEPLSGQGRIGVRDAGSLRKVDEWDSHGLDPHEFVPGPDGDLWVANGGIRTLVETGRSKRDLEHMDSSLVRLAAQDGALRGQWRLPDPRLGLRHLAWGRAEDGAPVLGIALQAEHEAPEARRTAPVLALFDGQQLRLAPASAGLGGYGGGIAAGPDSFAVSCTLAHVLARFDATGRPTARVALDSACAVASSEGAFWGGGKAGAVRLPPSDGEPQLAALPGEARLDNHWRALT